MKTPCASKALRRLEAGFHGINGKEQEIDSSSRSTTGLEMSIHK